MSEVVLKNAELITLRGSLTSMNVSEVQEDIEMELHYAPKIILDLTQLNKLDIAGVFMLMIVKQKAKTNGKKILILNSCNEIVTQAIKKIGDEEYY
ncbi:STAS domain-containing protein [Gillisia marina]|uniref:STAS domain-containing protein n=1 Tax=Gillisia marina TaxID=1167637 RepID=UPI00029B2FDD|nr:STAS domain-containing protein [Gillisia marina]